MRRLGASGLAVPRAVVAAVADVAGAVVGAVAPAHLSGAVVGAVAGEGHGGGGNCGGGEDAGGGCGLVELHGEPPAVGGKLCPGGRAGSVPAAMGRWAYDPELVAGCRAQRAARP